MEAQSNPGGCFQYVQHGHDFHSLFFWYCVFESESFNHICFIGFGGGVDDSASVENGRKIASHMLTRQKALDCLHKAQYNMDKAVEIFAENSLAEVISLVTLSPCSFSISL